MWISIFFILMNALIVQGRSLYDEEWDKTAQIKVKTDLNFKRRRNEYQFDRSVDCPEILNVAIDLDGEDVELELSLNTLLEPEQIPIFVGRNNEFELWSEYQRMPEKRRETCYYQSSNDDSFITIEDDFGYFSGKMSGSFSTQSGSYEFEQVDGSVKGTKSAKDKYRIRKIIFEGSYDDDSGDTEENSVRNLTPASGGATGSDTREKRSTPTPNFIEIMAVADFALYNRFLARTDSSKTLGDRESEAKSAIRYEFAQIFNGVDTRYKSIQTVKYTFRVYWKGLLIATDSASAPYTELIKISDIPRDSVDVSTTLENFLNWTTDAQQVSQFTGYDHIMMFSGYIQKHFSTDPSGLLLEK